VVVRGKRLKHTGASPVGDDSSIEQRKVDETPKKLHSIYSH